MRTALVTGVTGHVGDRLADRLREGGMAVRVSVRTAEAARAAELRGWQPVLADLADAASVGAAVAGVDAVVHAAGYLGTDWSTAVAVNVDGTARLAAAATTAGVRRFVHISTMSVHGIPQPDGLGEESPLDPDSEHPYVATKARAELALAAARERGLDCVILRPGAICTVRHSQWGDEMIERIRSGGWPANWHPDDVIPWGRTEDLAAMTWLAVTHPCAAGQTLIAADRNVAIRDYLVPLAEAVGRPAVAPDRAPNVSRCRIGRISRVLGYAPRHTFEQTLSELLELATSARDLPP